MLVKLLKHEFKACFKTYTSIFIIFLAVALVIRVMSFFNPEENTYLMISYGFLSVVFVISIYGLGIYATFGSVSRFNKNLFSDEGYLMNTLPVPSYYHILTKLITGIVFLILSSIIVTLSIFIAFLKGTDFLEIAQDFYYFLTSCFTQYPLETFLAIILIITIYCAFILLCYTSTALSSFVQKGKKAISVLLIIGVMIVNNILMSVFFSLADTMNIDSIAECLLIYILYFLIISIGLFFAINTIISKHLNIE